MKILAEWTIKTLVLLTTSYLIPGFRIDSYITAFVVAAVLGILNLLIKPLLIFFTLPFTIITFGLFIFVVNAIVLLIASSIVPGFHIDSFVTALFSAIVITIISSLLNQIFK
jgi:putative membrane protein